MFGIAGRLKKHMPLLVACTVIISAFVAFSAYMTDSGIRRGIKIESMDVSGMDPERARLLLRESVNRTYPEGVFSLDYGGRTWEFGLNAISYRFLVDDAVDRAYSAGRSGGFLSRLFSASSILMTQPTLKVENEFDRDKLAAILEGIKKEVDLEPLNSTVSYVSGKIGITPDNDGRRLGIDRSMKLVENHLRERDFKGIDLPVDVVRPAVPYGEVKEIDAVLSYFSTVFNSGDVNRSDNIRLACSKLNGRILMPGEEFSMNDTLGPRTIENGYKEAPVIYMNELIQGPGGGICQVTTTLYDAILLAKLQILERSHHSMPLGYVKPGQDATIAEDSIDFRFKNSTGYPVCLSAAVSGSRIDIRVLGRKGPGEQKVKLVSQVLAEYPPGRDEIAVDDSLADGEKVVVKEARKGLRVALYRETYTAGGELLERERISEDYYRPSDGLVKVNRNYYNIYASIMKGLEDE